MYLTLFSDVMWCCLVKYAFVFFIGLIIRLIDSTLSSVVRRAVLSANIMHPLQTRITIEQIYPFELVAMTLSCQMLYELDTPIALIICCCHGAVLFNMSLHVRLY